MITLEGTILYPSGAARGGLILYFKPLSTLFGISGNTIASYSISTTTDSSGDFSLELEPGVYELTIGTNKVFVPIPAGSGTYQLNDLLNFTFQNSSNSCLSFDRSDYVMSGEYVGGRHRLATAAQLLSATVTCITPPLGASLVLTAEVNGTLTAYTMTITSGQSGAVVDLASLDLPAGQYLRWKCTSSPPGVDSTAGGVNISTNLSVDMS